MTRFVLFFILFLFCSYDLCHGAETQPEQVITAADKVDFVSKFLSMCGSTPCTLAKSVVFFPVFPWFQYPYDDLPTNYQFKRFNRYSAVMDLMLSKQNESFSGYNMSFSFLKKWIGADAYYEMLNNPDTDQRTVASHLIFRFMPRKHIQPFFAIGWRFISTYKKSGNGLEISFFNYKISFSRFFNMFLANYIAFVDSYNIVHGVIGFEYFVYPTISVKSLIQIKHQFSQQLYGVTLGISLQM